jgi:hypothetical protein
LLLVLKNGAVLKQADRGVKGIGIKNMRTLKNWTMRLRKLEAREKKLMQEENRQFHITESTITKKFICEWNISTISDSAVIIYQATHLFFT